MLLGYFLFWSRWLLRGPSPSNIKLLHSHSRRSYGGSGLSSDWTTERTANGRSKSESTGAFYLDTPTYVRSTLDVGLLDGNTLVSITF